MINNEIFIHPGEWCFADKASRIKTLLGSCVAVTLWHPARRSGGLCHYLLPVNNEPHAQPNARYGNDVMAFLIDAIGKRSGNPKDYQAKIFGGANMFDINMAEMAVGDRNIEFARQALAQHGIPVVAEDVGGGLCRQLIFDTADGSVWLRRGVSRTEPRAEASAFAPGTLL